MREPTLCLRDITAIMSTKTHTANTHMDKKVKKSKSWRSQLSYLLKNSQRKRPTAPTVEELDQWAESMDKLLGSRYGRIAFHVFMKSEYCEENLEFWIACEELRQIKSSNKLRSKARAIYEEFVKCESPKEVNLDYLTRDAIEQTLSLASPSPSCFTGAQTKVYSLMENNCYPRFLLSSLYCDLRTSATQRDRRA
ncbi:regulator of G-protein signaling 2-like [Engraulis encrasicolus]|uniref:regulator of G-protein signaling 2-like n=1 Tax=Engraulis encrasicolus TaxID=184585 RepID=UPI002FD03831